MNAIQNNLKDSYGRPCLSFKKATKELFGRLTAENIGNAKLWEMYSDLVSSSENVDNSNEDDLYKGTFFSKVKLSLVILTTFKFSRQKHNAKIRENGMLQNVLNPKLWNFDNFKCAKSQFQP